MHIRMYGVYLEGKGWVMKMNTLDDLDQHFKDLGRLISGSKNNKGEFIMENFKFCWLIQNINDTSSELSKICLDNRAFGINLWVLVD